MAKKYYAKNKNNLFKYSVFLVTLKYLIFILLGQAFSQRTYCALLQGSLRCNFFYDVISALLLYIHSYLYRMYVFVAEFAVQQQSNRLANNSRNIAAAGGAAQSNNNESKSPVYHRKVKSRGETSGKQFQISFKI